MVLVFRQFGTSRSCFVCYCSYICVPHRIHRVPVSILWTMTGPQRLLFRPITSQHISGSRLIFRDVLCNCCPSIVQRWSRFVAHRGSPAIKNCFDSGAIQWRVSRPDFCVPLAGASVILQRSSPGWWLGALKVSVAVYHLWYTFAPFVSYVYIKWTHTWEFVCQFTFISFLYFPIYPFAGTIQGCWNSHTCFGLQQSGEFGLSSLF
jgi:hypothetical protein